MEVVEWALGGGASWSFHCISCACVDITQDMGSPISMSRRHTVDLILWTKGVQTELKDFFFWHKQAGCTHSCYLKVEQIPLNPNFVFHPYVIHRCCCFVSKIRGMWYLLWSKMFPPITYRVFKSNLHQKKPYPNIFSNTPLTFSSYTFSKSYVKKCGKVLLVIFIADNPVEEVCSHPSSVDALILAKISFCVYVLWNIVWSLKIDYLPRFSCSEFCQLWLKSL